MDNITYKESGVNIDEGNKAVEKIKDLTKNSNNKNILNGIGSFASLYDVSGYENPVLVSSTDGVGTKLEIAIKMDKLDTIGIDALGMCSNDILCHGAKPLFFLDYIATGKLIADNIEKIIKGIVNGCKEINCALVGGETAEMPGFYKDKDFDIAGFIVGIVNKNKIIDGTGIKEDDELIGISSSGLHSNGFSLVRKIINDYNMPFENKPIWHELLKPTTLYHKYLNKLLESQKIKGIAHITGGGLLENPQRMLKDDFDILINKKSIKTHNIFKYIQNQGVPENEMYRTFNMGIGLIICVSQNNTEQIISHLNSLNIDSYKIGKIIKGKKEICLK